MGFYKKKLPYKTKIGLLKKDQLEIHSDSIFYRDKKIYFNDVIDTRWGWSDTYTINFMPIGRHLPLGKNFNIFIATDKDNIFIQTKKKSIYTEVTDILLKTVCWNKMIQLTQFIQNGGKINLGKLNFTDNSVTLFKHGLLFKKPTPVSVDWGSVEYSSSEKKLTIKDSANKNVFIKLDYLHDSNTRVINLLLSIALKKIYTGNLSDFLQSEITIV